MAKNWQQRSWFGRNLAALAAVAVVGGAGTALLHLSSADVPANHNPTGGIDYCDLESGNTVIYGWGYDPDETNIIQPFVSITAGSQTTKISTALDYRTAVLNKQISHNYPSGDLDGHYGWKASFGTLYQGTTYKISGVVLNSGAGSVSYVSMPVQTNTHVDGDPSKQNFPGGAIPNACLTVQITKPPTPPPPPPPSPKPPSHGGSGGSTGSTGSTSGSNAPSDAADATVSAGTLGANLSVPTDGATAIHIAYGTDPSQLTMSTPDATSSGDNVTIALTGLSAKTDYSYQIVRTNSTGSATSATSNFTTKGYTISIAFQDANGKPVKGIKGSLDGTNQTATTGSDGIMTFKDLDDGSYSVTFTYQGQKHTLDYDTNSITDAGGPDQIAVLGDSIDVSQFSGSASQGGSSPLGIVLLVIFVLLLLAGAGWYFFFIRRRRQNTALVALPSDLPAAPTETPPLQPLPEPQLKPLSAPTQTHESLRDMVIKSMHEQAMQRAKDHKPPRPPADTAT